MHYDHQQQSSEKMSDKFNYFSKLPAEIRSMIWEYSLPEARVYEVLDAPNAKQKTPAQQGLMFANVHPEPPPALAAVCRESRYFVLHQYKALTLGATTKYVDLSRDLLLLEPYLLVKRLHRTLHFMSQIPLVRDNINRLALGTSYGLFTGICHPVLSWKVSKNNMGKMLQSLALFPKLKALIFIVHQEFQFEFDFRFPGTLTPGGMSTNQHPLHASSFTSHVVPSAPSSQITGVFTGGSPSDSPGAPPMPAVRPQAGSRPLAAPSAPAPAAGQSLSPLLPRPQLVHQAYRFKFDIEANINHTPRRPHLNELLYYPLDIDEDKDDDCWDGLDDPDENEWCDPWPTNDDWRRFRRRFQRAIHMTLEANAATTPPASAAEPSKGATACWPPKSKQRAAGGAGRDAARHKMAVPAIKGASLLWRYTRGGYV